MQKNFIAIILCFFIAACTTTKEVIVYKAPEIQEEMLDTLTVTAPPINSETEVEEVYELPVYHATATRKHDLIHTKLDISFNWEKQYVLGKAELTLSPLFYPQNTLELDAKGFDIHSVVLEDNMTELPFEYDGNKLLIDLKRTFKKGDEFVVYIDYTAKPNEGPEGGSAAITSDKGLFFINPLGKNPEKPMQIWTQGETENNSRWFPTFDKPNERCTQEISVTVNDKFTTLSNGKLVSFVKHKDGTRTDTWKQDKPHAPYLFMLAIGEYAVVKEKWNGIELEYYVEKDYEAYAKQIFNHTPEMLEFFSKKIKYPYPWDKYSQVVCRDYVSGAMENTTAVVYGEFVQKTDRELIDNENDRIVAHELFHHWFGDLVTCESWANLTLNEGFANYSEYLWYEYKYGKDKAEHNRFNEANGYFGSLQQQDIHPLIHFGYNDKEDMFNAHSYNKGGLVLHMLRDYVGDEAFYASLNKYLVDNEYTAVEVDELRMAFEDVTGEDMNWFFDQWFLEAGHPIIDFKYRYDPERKVLTAQIDQLQDPVESTPIFQFPLDIAIYDKSGGKTLASGWVNQRNQTIEIKDIPEEPSVVVMDDSNGLLAEVTEHKSKEAYLAQYRYSDNFLDKYIAATSISGSPLIKEIVPDLLDHSYYIFRKIALDKMKAADFPDMESKLAMMAKNDAHSSVRAAAIKKLKKYPNVDMVSVCREILQNEQAYGVLGTALKALYEVDKTTAIEIAEQYKDQKVDAMSGMLSDIFSSTGDAKYLPFFEDRLTTVSLYQMFNFYGKYFNLLKMQDTDVIMNASSQLNDISMSPDHGMFRKYMSTATLSKLKKNLLSRASKTETETEKTEVNEAAGKIGAMINLIKETETNETLLSQYRSF